MENMQKCVASYFNTSPLAQRDLIQILDIGGRDVNGSYADLFKGDQFKYIGVDIEAAEGVSIILDDPYKLPLPDNSIDVVLSGQMLEHCEFFWQTFAEMVRVSKDDGFIFLVAPSGGPIHRYPVDCYRFYPDAYRALAKYANCHAIDIWLDERGPWRDLVGVFSKTKRPKRSEPAFDVAAVEKASQLIGTKPDKNDPVEKLSGAGSYLETLALLHRELQPRNYLEIGVWRGASLSLANCPAVGVDPKPGISTDLKPNTRLVKTSSDFFFEQKEDEILKSPIDLAFIDGMHLFEFALRDFMNIERHARRNTVVVVDDIFPNHPDQAKRERSTSAWTGDVWKLIDVFSRFRQDLILVKLDTYPTGLLMILGLDPKNRILWEKYNPIVGTMIPKHPPPQEIINRDYALKPISDQFERIMDLLKYLRNNNVPIASRRTEFLELLRYDLS